MFFINSNVTTFNVFHYVNRVMMIISALNLIRIMVFNATFNNISVILWHAVLLVEETRVPGENHRPVASH